MNTITIILIGLILLLSIVMIIILVPFIRQKLISLPVLNMIRYQLPSMSKTEQEAIDAGTVWWEAELFRGKPDWHKLHQCPEPHLSPEERAFLDGPVNQVCSMVCDYEVTHHTADLPPTVWAYLKQHRFFALIIEKQYGGLQFSPYAQSLILQKLAGVSSILSITVGVPNSLGPGELLQHYGTDEQKWHYLPKLASGEEIPCFTLTSPEAGSDAAAIPDQGVVSHGEWQGHQILGIRLNWNKRYITLAPIATVLGLAFKLYDPDQLLSQEKERGITCALIPTHLPGIKIGRRHFPLNIPFQNGPTQGEDVFIPLDLIIGGAQMVGQGWRMLVECLSVGRGITLPSNSTGIVKTTALAIGAYARIRRQFKQPIGAMEGIEEPLARIAGYAYSMDAASQLTMSALNQGEKPAIVSAIIKYHCTQRAQQALKDAMDIAGGKGICLGPNNFLARYYQGAPIAVTVEGANILTRSLIIFGQGATRCHPYLIEEMALAQQDNTLDTNRILPAFDKVLRRHIRYVIRNITTSFVLGLTDGRGSSFPFDDPTKRFYQHLNRYSANLAFMTDLSLFVLGGSLKRKERLSARLADVLSHLYLASAVLKRFDDDGRLNSDLPIVEWAIRDNLYQMEQALVALIGNYPKAWMRRFIRFIVMPFGPHRHPPSDRIDHLLAQILQTPSEARDRIGREQYLTPGENNPAGNINSALSQLISIEPIVKKIERVSGKRIAFRFLDKIAHQAIAEGFINQDEHQRLIEAEKTRLAVINVDDFSPTELSHPSV